MDNKRGPSRLEHNHFYGVIPDVHTSIHPDGSRPEHNRPDEPQALKLTQPFPAQALKAEHEVQCGINWHEIGTKQKADPDACDTHHSQVGTSTAITFESDLAVKEQKHTRQHSNRSDDQLEHSPPETPVSQKAQDYGENAIQPFANHIPLSMEQQNMWMQPVIYKGYGPLPVPELNNDILKSSTPTFQNSAEPVGSTITIPFPVQTPGVPLIFDPGYHFNPMPWIPNPILAPIPIQDPIVVPIPVQDPLLAVGKAPVSSNLAPDSFIIPSSVPNTQQNSASNPMIDHVISWLSENNPKGIPRLAYPSSAAPSHLLPSMSTMLPPIVNSQNSERNTPQLAQIATNQEDCQPATQNQAGSKIYKCGECDLTFPTQKKLGAHKYKKRILQKRHQCKWCKYVYGQAAGLRRHLMKKHLPEQQIKCQKCKRHFKDVANLKLHNHFGCTGIKQNAVDNRETFICCNKCGELFQRFEDLEDHHLSYERNGVKRFSILNLSTRCPVCEEDFRRRPCYFPKHLKSHTAQTPGESRCKTCLHSFPDSVIQNHKDLCMQMHFHTGYKLTLIPCKKCGTIFMTKEELKVHLKLEHNELSLKLGIPCALCGLKFSTRGKLYIHRLRAHKAVAFLKCSICRKSFTLAATLRKHQELFHPC